MSKWETYDDFMYEHLSLTHDICKRCITVNQEAVSNLAFDLWNHAKEFATRSHTTLVFDCCYIVGNATGNKVSVPLLQNISADVFDGRRIKAMATYENKDRWFLSPKGKEVIMHILQGNETLYHDVVSRWMDDESIDITGEVSEHWCEPCGVRNVSGQHRLDIMDEIVKPILMCPTCMKWEWDEQGV